MDDPPPVTFFKATYRRSTSFAIELPQHQGSIRFKPLEDQSVSVDKCGNIKYPAWALDIPALDIASLPRHQVSARPSLCLFPEQIVGSVIDSIVPPAIVGKCKVERSLDDLPPTIHGVECTRDTNCD